MSDINKKHYLYTEDAIKYGTDEALILQHIKFWMFENKDKPTHQYYGKVWMYQSVTNMMSNFPYWKRNKIQKLLKRMEVKELIVSDNFNKKKYDKTKWYSLASPLYEQWLSHNGLMESSKRTNGIIQKDEPIPDIETNIKKDIYNRTLFDNCYVLYQRGNRSKAFKLWKQLTSEQREEIAAAIPNYIRVCEHQYRYNFENWINPLNEHWKDKVSVQTRIVLK